MWHYPTLGKDLPPTWELVLLAILLVVFLALGVWAILWVKHWRQHDTCIPSQEDELSSYRQLLEQGLLLQEEFDRVQAQLTQKVFPKDPAPASQPQPQPSAEPQAPAADSPPPK